MSSFNLNILILKPKRHTEDLKTRLNKDYLTEITRDDLGVSEYAIDNFVQCAQGYSSIDRENGTGVLTAGGIFYSMSWTKRAYPKEYAKLLLTLKDDLTWNEGDILFFSMYENSSLFEIVYIKNGIPTYVNDQCFSYGLVGNYNHFIDAMRELTGTGNDDPEADLSPAERFDFMFDLKSLPCSILNRKAKSALFRVTTEGIMPEQHVPCNDPHYNVIKDGLSKHASLITTDHYIDPDVVRVHLRRSHSGSMFGATVRGNNELVGRHETYDVVVEYTVEHERFYTGGQFGFSYDLNGRLTYTDVTYLDQLQESELKQSKAFSRFEQGFDNNRVLTSDEKLMETIEVFIETMNMGTSNPTTIKLDKSKLIILNNSK